MSNISLIESCISRYGYAMKRNVLRAFIPAKSVGTYVLLKRKKPIYVGRSDKCVLTRLCNHELFSKATHVVWEPSCNAEKAYIWEASWFHEFKNAKKLLNKIHPARPAHYKKPCPFCNQRDWEGLKAALPLNTVIKPGVD